MEIIINKGIPIGKSFLHLKKFFNSPNKKIHTDLDYHSHFGESLIQILTSNTWRCKYKNVYYIIVWIDHLLYNNEQLILYTFLNILGLFGWEWEAVHTRVELTGRSVKQARAKAVMKERDADPWLPEEGSSLACLHWALSTATQSQVLLYLTKLFVPKGRLL